MNRVSLFPLLVLVALLSACGSGDEPASNAGASGEDTTAIEPDGSVEGEDDAEGPAEDAATSVLDVTLDPGDAPVGGMDTPEPTDDVGLVPADAAPIDDVGVEPTDDAGVEPPGDVGVVPVQDVATDVVDNLPPVAVDDLAKIPAGGSGTIPVLLNDSDPDGDPLGIKSVTQGSHGVVAIIPGGGLGDDTLEYTTLSADYSGLDTITYTVHDGQGNEDTATVTINILMALPDPVLTITSPTEGEVIEGDTVTIEFEVVGCNFTTPSVDSAGCHGHKYLDGEKWWASDGSAGHGHYTTASFTVFPLTDGPHTVEFALHRNDGTDGAWIPAVSATVTFEVVGGLWQPPSVDGAIHRIQYAGETKDLLLGTESGLYETSAGGTELTSVFDGPDMTSLVQDAFEPETYHASGHWAAEGLSNWGFVTSEDGGESWTNVSLSGLVAFEHLAVSPDQAGLLAAASPGQLHVSADAGATWETYPWVKPVTGLAIAGAEGPVLLVASADGVERVVLPEVVPTLLFAAPITGLDRVSGGFAYGTADGTVALCNASLSVCDELIGPSLFGSTSVLVDPDFPTVIHVLTTGSEVHRSVDGGTTWELLVVGS